ncbi:ATP synthase F1 subunit epsilon [Aerococcaceae bacterium DSM 111021]|nr:ATP synthase F1 subunit epsilon [Aerococcaceae bacterium DSM 111021]
MAKKHELLQVNIYAPEGLIYTHYSRGVVVKTTDGEMTILPNHIPVITSLTVGSIKVSRREESMADNYIAINGGILEMHDNVVEITATYAIRSRDIDEGKALIEKQQAEAELETALSNNDTVAHRRARIALSRAINKINVGAKKF